MLARRNILISMLGATVLCSLVYVRSRFLVIELSYDINQKRSEKEQLEKNHRELSLELSVLKSPKRIENLAQEKYHLSYKPKTFHQTIPVEGNLHEAN
ncbi:MAG: cell division protein FtsL [Bdellovibrionota bacterium]